MPAAGSGEETGDSSASSSDIESSRDSTFSNCSAATSALHQNHHHSPACRNLWLA
ncbi:hypothetical protein GQ55_5G150900 [Panicum hallii var. hallii]|uniref:Uncharacterized protein n=1 Tax=Panicum hallii var. hallii TaxID=1504633 RepID=A0A2T7DGI3_9POAL|nr:hypothetical protein GQ55_5G150900 [Panicum hallii var. hallii]